MSAIKTIRAHELCGTVRLLDGVDKVRVLRGGLVIGVGIRDLHVEALSAAKRIAQVRLERRLQRAVLGTTHREQHLICAEKLIFTWEGGAERIRCGRGRAW